MVHRVWEPKSRKGFFLGAYDILPTRPARGLLWAKKKVEGGEYGQTDDPVPWLQGDFVTGYETNPYDPIIDWYPTVSIPSIPVGIPAPPIYPTVTVTTEPEPTEVGDVGGAGGGSEAPAGDPEDYGDAPVVSAEPVFGSPYLPSPEGPIVSGPVIWQDPETHLPEGTEVATDWGAIIGGVADIYSTYSGVAQPTTIQPISYPTSPAGTYTPGVTIDPKTGKAVCTRRRRRRKLLTNGDFNDLLRISTLPNKDTVKIALAKAIR